ncbi:MAG: PBSX family phage terminase large subunit [Clostridia bacterium]|nr:PBSX family phage terminase large subunit [Clostridia bacterium]MBR3095060.1 PBSX family phage terminase large subunit [Clostridia bacterium]
MTPALRSFSKKQKTVLSWWHPLSPFGDRDAIICDGAVRSGKTTCMALSFVLWTFHGFDGGAFALCGKTIQSLRRNLLEPLLPLLLQLGFSAEEKVSQNKLTLSFGGKQNRFWLFGGRDESSAALIQGMTLCGVLFDEAALMPRSFVEQALARCSAEGAKFWFNCNPEHPQHWFYREWICKAEQRNCLYLHFTMRDNPSLSEQTIRRYESLYSGAFYDRFVRGLWVAAEGLVYPEAAAGAFTREPPQTAAERWCVSCDYGTVNPMSMGLWGKFGGAWYRVEEVYFDSKTEGRQKTDEEYYDDLCALTAGRRIDCVTVDPSAASFLACLRSHGRFTVLPAVNEVLPGIRRVHEAFRQQQLFISPACKAALREFSLYRWDRNEAKDAVIKANDHAMDDIRYFVSTVLCRPQDDAPIAIAVDRKNG